MDQEKINKILKIVKDKELIRVGDVERELRLNPATALAYLLEMQIRGLLERNDMKKNNNYVYKIWRLKKD